MNYFMMVFFTILAFNSSLNALPAQILIIRNGERLPLGNSLSTKGKERAVAMVPLLLETKEFQIFGNPVAIYAMGASDINPSTRAIETVQPLATALNLIIKNGFTQNDYKKMVDEIKADATYKGKSILICWDSLVIPELARALGALQTPSKWPGDYYDRIWQIKFSSTGKATAIDVAQRLLFGDSTH